MTIDMSELVTRAILKEELQKFRVEMTADWTSALQSFQAGVEARFERQREDIRADMMSAVRMVQADFERNQALALEPTKDLPARVTKLETLPERVDRLEAKVFPPKRASRRR